MESEHFVVFWEKEFGNDPTKAASGYAFNPKTMLADGEKYWNKYVELGFINPGKSTTDKYKIEMFVKYTKDWVANGSGVDPVSYTHLQMIKPASSSYCRGEICYYAFMV